MFSMEKRYRNKIIIIIIIIISKPLQKTCSFAQLINERHAASVKVIY